MSLLDKILPPDIIYLRLLKNKIIVRDVRTGREIEKKADVPFSNDRLIIAEFEPLETILRTALNEVQNKKGKVSLRNMKMVIQVMDETIIEMTSTEKRAYRDTASFCGARMVWLEPSQNILTDDFVINNFDAQFRIHH